MKNRNVRRFLYIAAFLIALGGLSKFAFRPQPLSFEERATVERAWNPPPDHVTRGLAEQPHHVQWAALPGAMITLDNDMITGMVGLLTALTLLFALLSKYLLRPMIREEMDLRMKEMVSSKQFEEYKEHDIEDHRRLEASVNAIWEKVSQ